MMLRIIPEHGAREDRGEAGSLGVREPEKRAGIDANEFDHEARDAREDEVGGKDHTVVRGAGRAT